MLCCHFRLYSAFGCYFLSSQQWFYLRMHHILPYLFSHFDSYFPLVLVLHLLLFILCKLPSVFPLYKRLHHQFIRFSYFLKAIFGVSFIFFIKLFFLKTKSVGMGAIAIEDSVALLAHLYIWMQHIRLPMIKSEKGVLSVVAGVVVMILHE